VIVPLDPRSQFLSHLGTVAWVVCLIGGVDIAVRLIGFESCVRTLGPSGADFCQGSRGCLM
jgi:hypothetical protein